MSIAVCLLGVNKNSNITTNVLSKKNTRSKERVFFFVVFSVTRHHAFFFPRHCEERQRRGSLVTATQFPKIATGKALAMTVLV